MANELTAKVLSRAEVDLWRWECFTICQPVYTVHSSASSRRAVVYTGGMKPMADPVRKIDMTASPSTGHQGISMELGTRLHNALQNHPCRVFASALDVFLPGDLGMEEDDVTTVVEPDIMVVCDRSQLRERGCWGPPTLVVEILSPYTSAKDMSVKRDLYERTGVAEYWIIDPGNECVLVYALDAHGLYPESPAVLVGEVILKCGADALAGTGFSIPLSELFAAACY